MKTTFILLTALALSLSSVLAQSETTTQTPTTDVISPTNADSALHVIDEQIATLEKTVVQLKQATNKKFDDKPTQMLINVLPVSSEHIDKAIETLSSEEEASIKDKINDVSQISAGIEERIKVIETKLSKLNAKEKNIKALQGEYEKLEQLLSNPVYKANASIENQEKASVLAADIAQLYEWLEKEKKSTNQQLDVLRDSNKLLAHWHSALIAQRQKQSAETYNNTQLSQEVEQLRDEINQLQRLLQNNNLSFSQTDKTQREIYAKNVQLWLIDIDKSLMRIMNTFDLDWKKVSLEDIKPGELETQYTQLHETRYQLKQLKILIDEKFIELKEYIDIRGGTELLDLQAALIQRQQAINYQYLQLKKQLLSYGEEVDNRNQKVLYTLDKLYSGNQLKLAINGSLGTLQQVRHQIQISFQKLFERIKTRPVFITLWALIACIIFVTCVYGVLYGLKHLMTNDKAPNNFHFLFSTLQKYLYIFVLYSLLASIVNVSGTTYPSGEIILTLIYGLTAVVIWMNMIYTETLSGVLTKKQTFYRYAVTILLVGCAVFYSIAQHSSINSNVLSFYEKILMIALSLFVWLERKKFVSYLTVDSHKTGKLHRLYQSVLKLLPLSIITSCVIGLIGFGRLAWSLLNYIWAGTLYIALIVIGFKIIDALRKKAKSYSMKHFKHGAFVASDIVAPLSTIVKFLWVCGVSGITLIMLGLDSNKHSMTDFFLIVQSPLIKVGTVEINLQMIILSLLTVYLVFKFARWLKTFSYQVIYSRIQDLGVRSSLSVFTQYSATLIGLLIVMNLLGIDLTSLTVFAGALGVGIGFGLQDIAKNFISGILLLIERPLHNGDWVNIDNYEGKIKNIGMRAITMETFDKKEVIIPNISVISNSFTNNTHSNPILRTILYIGADYDSEPKTVIDILKDIMQANDGILDAPGFVAVLWEYADSSINYRIQYHVNTDSHSLLAVRNAVLEEVWHRFKQEGIGIPYPQRDIHVHTALT